ncbi:hypothetical protein QL285_097084 [Trifolium repens]|nr:hypothetical protein QL285_097084 [Trifolium repens]
MADVISLYVIDLTVSTSLGISSLAECRNLERTLTASVCFFKSSRPIFFDKLLILIMGLLLLILNFFIISSAYFFLYTRIPASDFA